MKIQLVGSEVWVNGSFYTSRGFNSRVTLHEFCSDEVCRSMVRRIGFEVFDEVVASELSVGIVDVHEDDNVCIFARFSSDYLDYLLVPVWRSSKRELYDAVNSDSGSSYFVA